MTHWLAHIPYMPTWTGWFDAWLDRERAAARREGQAEAWDEGYRAGADDMSDLRAGRLTFQTITSNPHQGAP